MRKNAMAVGAAAILIALASPATAQGMGGMGMGGAMWQGLIGKLCAKDIDTHCAGIAQGSSQRACLEGKSKDLSENCRLAPRVHGAGSRTRTRTCFDALHERDQQVLPGG